MGYRENYRDTQGGDFELMPEGRYPIKIIASSIGASKSSGKDSWKLEMEVVGPRFSGRKLWLYVSMSPEAKGVRKGTMTALGFDTNNPETGDFDLLRDPINCRAYAEIFHDEYQGTKREKVKRLRSMEANESRLRPEGESREEVELPEDDLPDFN